VTNSRDIGAATEADFLSKIKVYFPDARRTKSGWAGVSGADIDTKSVGLRAFEITRADWAKMSTKAKQVQAAADKAGVTMWAIFKKTAGWHGSRAYHYCIMDADQALALMAAADQLRAQVDALTARVERADRDVQAAYDNGFTRGLASPQRTAQ
jgi:hypothetical protein